MNKLALTVLLGILVISSCTKDDSLKLNKLSNTHELVVPTGFTWETSRDVYFDINITDTSFPTSLYVVSIYDKDPSLGGKLLSKGSASQNVHFTTKIYLANTIKEVFVAGTEPTTNSPVMSTSGSNLDSDGQQKPIAVPPATDSQTQDFYKQDIE